ncbi:MAG: putative metal-dependent hydrolase [Dactylosporangium sp.]|jgi:arylformamidase|nr:putative metal-dependent hydrolase [Dactylosporangium sp.]
MTSGTRSAARRPAPSVRHDYAPVVIVDLSHEIVAGMTTYPGTAPPGVQVTTSREASAARLGTGVSFEIGSATLVGNTGTYLDSPYHYHPDRADIAQLPLERLVNVPVAIIHAFGEQAVTAAHLGDPGALWGKAVLVYTGWARYWRTARYLDFDCPHLTVDAVEALVNANVALVGIDSLNIDDPTDPHRPAHHGLLGADIPIIEHLTNLERVPVEGARLTALPPPVRGMASFPVRAVATYET